MGAFSCRLSTDVRVSWYQVEQLDACKRRLEYLDGERRSAEPDSEEERTRKLIEQVHSLQDDVASLTALRSSSTQRLALLREMGIVRTVGHKRQMTLNRVLQAWRRCPSFGAEAQRSALNIRACKDKLLALQVARSSRIREATSDSDVGCAPTRCCKGGRLRPASRARYPPCYHLLCNGRC